LIKKLTDNFTVLTFDFRGHGDSTKIQSTLFWKHPRNVQIKGAKPTKSFVLWQDFSADYWPMLTNDIAAAKRFLDQQNDAGFCNSSNTILLGVEEGAALGELYLATAWSPQPYNLPLPGADMFCSVWLSPTAGVGKSRFTYTDWIRQQVPQRAKTPTYLLYGAEDTKARPVAVAIERALKDTKQATKLTAQAPIKEAKAIRGTKLLQGSLPTEKLILDYLARVMDDVGSSAPKRKNIEMVPAFEVNWRPLFPTRQ
jgi:hypothetical protein